jgi:RNA polymerase sigma factor (sigma-70 family)
VSALPDEGKSAAASRLVASQLTTLYKRYHDDVYAYCRRRLRNKEEAEDATQVTFVKAFAAFRRGVVPDAEAAWLFTIAKRVVLTRLEVTNRLRAVETYSELDHFEAPNATDRSEVHELQRAVEALPDAARRAFVMREWQGLEYEEIADELGLRRSHVGVILLRARRQVTKQLRAVLNFGPASALVRRGLEMLTADGAHFATASAVAATAPVLLAVAPVSTAAAKTHPAQPSHVAYVAAGTVRSFSPADSPLTVHGLTARSSRAPVVTVAAHAVVVHPSPVAVVPTVVESPAPTGIVDPVEPAAAAVDPAPVDAGPVDAATVDAAQQDPVREVASDPAVTDATTNDPQPDEPPVDTPVAQDSDPATPPAPSAPTADDTSSAPVVATPPSGVQPGQGQATADSTPGHANDHPEQSSSSTAPGHATSTAPSDTNNGNGNGNGNGSNASGENGNGNANANANGRGNGNGGTPPANGPDVEGSTPDVQPAKGNGNANSAANGNGNGNGNAKPSPSSAADSAPPAADPPAATGNANGNGKSPEPPLVPDPAPPAADPPAPNGNGNGDANGNGKVTTPAAPPATPADTVLPADPPAKGKKK